MSDIIYCRACGQQVHTSALTCPHCNASTAASGSGGKNKVVAAVLAFFLGGFGVHRFYLGQWWGIFYVLLFWTLIPGLVALVEAIVFLCTSDKNWDAKYNKGVPSSGGSSAAIIIGVVVGVFFLIAIIGILAAIAIPQFSEYQNKAKLKVAYTEGNKATTKVGAYFEKNKVFPKTLEEAGAFSDATSEHISKLSIDPATGTVSVSLKGSPKNRSLLFVPSLDADKKMTWECSGDGISKNKLPKECQ